MSANPIVRMTPEEYLEAERKAEFKSEYYGGEVYAMAGGSYPHGIIIGNLCSELRQVLKGTSCIVTPTEVKLRVSGGLYTYPDIMVVCEEPRFADDQKDTLLNPTVIIEVLSESTEAYDRGVKSTKCRALDSVQEYVLVSQYQPRVERFGRLPSGQWLLSDCAGIDAICRFESLKCEIPMAEIYYNVKFTIEPGGMRRMLS